MLPSGGDETFNVSANISAGGSVLIAQNVNISIAPEKSVAFGANLTKVTGQAGLLGTAAPAISDATRSKDPLEKALNDQIDRIRDEVIEDNAPSALKLLQGLLSNLPASASSAIVFRIKANIGHCYLQMGDDAAAASWLGEAYDASPSEPKAAANKVLALMLSGDANAAFEFAKNDLAQNPENEFTAAHLLQAASWLADVPDPYNLIPIGLREREEVLIGRTIYLQRQQRRPDWWDLARSVQNRFPNNRRFKLIVAEAALDEATYEGAFQSARGLSEAVRQRVLSAAQIVEDAWEKLRKSAVPDRRESVQIAWDGLVAAQILKNPDKSILFAEHLVKHADDEDLLIMVAQASRASGRNDLASRALDKLGDSPKGDFVRGMILLDQDDWANAAISFSTAEIPESENTIVQTVIALSRLIHADTEATAEAFEEARTLAGGDPRASIVLARVAERKGLEKLATDVFEKAKASLRLDSTLAERSMLAAFASERNDARSIIEILDGFIPENVTSQELRWLAEAHALERPKHERNLRFFDRLSTEIRQNPSFARCRATVLLDAGRKRQAEGEFRRLFESDPSDTYSLLRLIEILGALDRRSEIVSVVGPVDEYNLKGPPQYRILFALQLRAAGFFDRALKFAYEVVRRDSDDPAVCLGYVSLILGADDREPIPTCNVASEGAWVHLVSETGESQSFVIENGSQFLGIETVSPQAERAKRVLGMAVGETLGVDKGPFPAVMWTVKELKSKFLHLLHVIMNDFEKRHPGANGLWRVDIKDNDIKPILDFIRKKSEADREAANSYSENGLPLSFVARMLGGEPVGFAQFVRSIDRDVITWSGLEPDRRQAFRLAKSTKGSGIVLDEYTAFVAAEMEILPILKAWHGSLMTPSSTLANVDKLIEREETGLRGGSMSISWKGGEFFRTEMTEEFVQAQIDALRRVRERIVTFFEIEQVLLPDDLPPLARQIITQIGGGVLDAVLLAGSKRLPLLSDDLRYRQVAQALYGTQGLWLQTVLTCAFEAGLIDKKTLASSYVQLAARRHGIVSLDPDILCEIVDNSPDDALTDFDVVTEFIGNKNAEMRSHVLVTIRFLRRLWERRSGDLRCQTATAIIVRKLIRLRHKDWAQWFSALLFGPIEVKNYLIDFRIGHFLPERPIASCYADWKFAIVTNPRSKLD